MLANITPVVFTRNKRKDPLIKSQLNLAIPMPVVARGGIIATEIAIPGSVSFSWGFTKAKDPAKPTIRAMIA